METIMGIVGILIFCIAPIAGVSWIIFDIVKSRRISRELQLKKWRNRTLRYSMWKKLYKG